MWRRTARSSLPIGVVQVTIADWLRMIMTRAMGSATLCALVDSEDLRLREEGTVSNRLA